MLFILPSHTIKDRKISPSVFIIRFYTILSVINASVKIKSLVCSLTYFLFLIIRPKPITPKPISPNTSAGTPPVLGNPVEPL